MDVMDVVAEFTSPASISGPRQASAFTPEIIKSLINHQLLRSIPIPIVLKFSFSFKQTITK